ncbi:MAG: divalent metal cation transporter [Rhizomicrobium sp.]
MSEAKHPHRSLRHRLRSIALFNQLGPGLITGAADDDPSGIATYSQGGAQFGFGLLWTLVLTFPLMAAIQLISAHIGRITGKGLADNMGKVQPQPVVLSLVALLFVANTINIGADVAAMVKPQSSLPDSENMASRSCSRSSPSCCRCSYLTNATRGSSPC